VITYSFVPYDRVLDRAYAASSFSAGGPFPPPGITTDFLEGNPTQGLEAAVQGNPTRDVDNTVRDPFDPPPGKSKYNLVISITRNERSKDNNKDGFSPDVLRIYQNTLNLNQITVADITIPPYAGLLRKFSSNKQWDSEGNEYWEVTYEVEVDVETHLKVIVNQGFYDVNRNVNRDESGKDQQIPSRLAIDGSFLGAADTTDFVVFMANFSIDWKGLDLPTIARSA